MAAAPREEWTMAEARRMFDSLYEQWIGALADNPDKAKLSNAEVRAFCKLEVRNFPGHTVGSMVNICQNIMRLVESGNPPYIFRDRVLPRDFEMKARCLSVAYRNFVESVKTNNPQNPEWKMSQTEELIGSLFA